MSNLTRYGVANMDQLLDRITRNSVGMDEYFDTIFGTAQGNYPPYNFNSRRATPDPDLKSLSQVSRRMKSMSTQNTVNSLLRARRKIKKRKTLSTRFEPTVIHSFVDSH